MKKRILIIEDNKENRALEKFLLEAAGFEIREAFCASSGVDIAREEKPDAIIMDVRLSDMRGTEAARMLRENETLRDIPIIFVTASVVKDSTEEIGSISNSACISKPINTRTFAQEIGRYIK